ncbi:MAG: hypothetical protein PHS57_04595 [Alphaproteobacteria bacterium]|nr:hypothetical protein [Alphaproteobacteria bacterium]
MVNEIALGLLLVLAGWIMGRLRLERWLEQWVQDVRDETALPVHSYASFDARIREGWNAVADIVGRIWLFVVIGVGLGAFVHGYVPQDLMASVRYCRRRHSGCGLFVQRTVRLEPIVIRMASR